MKPNITRYRRSTRRVTLRRRVWIETQNSKGEINVERVTLRRRVWIETRQQRGIQRDEPVTLRRRVWIETSSGVDFSVSVPSPSAGGCGLKHEP